MRIMDGKIWVALLILAAVALVSSAAVVGGIEWIFASLGAMVLIGITVIGIHTLFKVLQYSRLSLKVPWLGRNITGSRIAKVGPVSKRDRRIIMRHIDELFSAGRDQDGERLVEVRPVSSEDKRIIMRHIDELFTVEQEQSEERFS